jgi:hypothetical protein
MAHISAKPVVTMTNRGEATVNPQIESAKSEFERICGRLLKNLATTPDDKLNWSPAPSARTPLEIAFHCAKSIALLHGCIDGRDTMPSLTSEQFDAHFREQERNLGSREDVVKMIHENSAAYITWLEGLSEEKLSGTWNSPFGEVPVATAITFPGFHASGHVSQLEYIQTIYGDRVWH